MNYPKSALTLLISVIYFYLFNNPNIIRFLKIKTDSINYIFYAFLYMLLLYSTIKSINYFIKDDITEHFNYNVLIDDFAKKIQSKMNFKKGDKDYKLCETKIRGILKDLKTQDDLKMYLNMIGNMKCLDRINKNKLCHKLDMSRYILKNSIPDCSKVLPEQYGLYKPRKGEKGDDDDDDDDKDKNKDDLNLLINKHNYIIFYLLFVFIVGTYTTITIFQNIFNKSN